MRKRHTVVIQWRSQWRRRFAQQDDLAVKIEISRFITMPLHSLRLLIIVILSRASSDELWISKFRVPEINWERKKQLILATIRAAEALSDSSNDRLIDSSRWETHQIYGKEVPIKSWPQQQQASQQSKNEKTSDAHSKFSCFLAIKPNILPTASLENGEMEWSGEKLRMLWSSTMIEESKCKHSASLPTVSHSNLVMTKKRCWNSRVFLWYFLSIIYKPNLAISRRVKWDLMSIQYI